MSAMGWGPLSRLGLTAAVAAALADQALKLWLLFVFDLPARGVVRLTPFLDLVLIWNKGISYGLFQQDGPFGQWVLLALKATAVALLWIWLARSHSRLTAAALGLIIGGAVGNAVDRIAYGAVADFVLFHVTSGSFSFKWYVFNLADTAIVAGVAGLLYDSLVRQPPQNSPDPDDNALGSGGGSPAQGGGPPTQRGGGSPAQNAGSRGPT